MKFEKCTKPSFVVIGKLGSTKEGSGFIQKLWQEANGLFDEVADLAKRDDQGRLVGIWGAMSDFKLQFQPWENFQDGYYLAGVECRDDTVAPAGWTKWVIPGFEYRYVKVDQDYDFQEAVNELRKSNLQIVGAVHDFTLPTTGENYVFFPIKKL